MTRGYCGVLLALACGLAAGRAAAAVTAAAGYAVRTIPTPDTVQGGVVRRGPAILVGQGPTFTVGAESIIRFNEGGTPVTIATGFNSLGGFDLDAAGTLYVVDNGGTLPGALTGGTVYGIPSALTRTTAVTAAGQEVMPSGSIPNAQDVLVAPDGRVLVSDARGPGLGRVLVVPSTTPFIGGLDFLGGLAIDGTKLLVGNVTGAFVDEVLEYGLDGTPAGTLATNLPGAYGVVVDADGFVLVSGEFSLDCSGRVMAIAPDGTVSERARGFCASTDMYFDPVRDETLVLDFGATAITALCRDLNGNGTCDADELCVAPAFATGVKLALGKLATPPGDDTLALHGSLALPASFPVDPVVSGARVVLAGAGGTVLDVRLPAGARTPGEATGWKANKKRTVFTYTGDGSLGGIVKVTVRTSVKAPGRVGFSVVGKHGSYPVTTGDLPLTATFVLTSPGGCGGAAFAAPQCTANARRGTLHCG